MIRCAAGIHEGLRHYGQTRVDNISFSEIKNKIGILDQVHPEPKRQRKLVRCWILILKKKRCIAFLPEWQRIRFPGMDNFRIGDSVLQSLVVQKVEQILQKEETKQ